MNYRPLHEIRHAAADEIAGAHQRRRDGYDVGRDALDWLAIVTADVCRDIDDDRLRGAAAAALRVSDALLVDWQDLGLTLPQARNRALYWRQAAAVITFARTA